MRWGARHEGAEGVLIAAYLIGVCQQSHPDRVPRRENISESKQNEPGLCQTGLVDL